MQDKRKNMTMHDYAALPDYMTVWDFAKAVGIETHPLHKPGDRAYKSCLTFCQQTNTEYVETYDGKYGREEFPIAVLITMFEKYFPIDEPAIH